jgi:hypothetical protein
MVGEDSPSPWRENASSTTAAYTGQPNNGQSASAFNGDDDIEAP